MATSLSLENDPSLAQGYIKVNGTTAATITTSGITANVTGNVTGSLTQGGSLTLETAKSASGAAVDFTGIPSWTKRITVMFNGISTNGSSIPIIQIGSGSIKTSGYTAASGYALNAGASIVASQTTGFPLTGSFALSASIYANAHLALVSNNNWLFSISGMQINLAIISGGGSASLSSTLNQIRITTVNGTDAFDAGIINISYEG